MRIFLTGNRGYVGSVLERGFRERGWTVVSPPQSWRMPAAPDHALLAGADAVVHAAWDLRPPDREHAQEVNVVGSREIFDSASAAGVGRIVFISSLSAFVGCRSDYGQLKLEAESDALRHGACVVRPGLVYGDDAGGMVGKLSGLVRRLPVIPVPCAGAFQFLVHEDDLAAYVCRAVEGRVPCGVVTVANPSPVQMIGIVRELARRLGRPRVLIPVPSALAESGLRIAETFRIPLPVTRDNLLGLANANPAPDFRPLQESGVEMRAFVPGK